MNTNDLDLIVRKMGDIRIRYFLAVDEIAEKYPGWERRYDARITLFAKAGNILMSTNLSLVLMVTGLGSAKWWRAVGSEDIPLEDKQHYAQQLHSFIQLAYLQLFHAAIESSLRAIVRAVSPGACKDGNGEYAQIYQHLLTLLDLREHIPTFNLFRLIRNTIHNNTLIMPPSGQSEQITYDGTTYDFRVGEFVTIANWDFVLRLADNLYQIAREIIYHPKVAALESIVDPAAARHRSET